jgi:glycosyltransferase involved in cell wall biosynthesis
MRILTIVPLPPPVTGHSLVSQVLVDSLRARHEVVVVNLSRGSLNDGRVTWERVREVGKVLFAVWRRKRWADVFYLTISESPAGNLKDLFIYSICLGRLNRLFVHLHGGTIGRELFDRHPVWRKVNAVFIRRVGGVVISGAAHLDIFAGMIEPARVHIVPNSAEDKLFVPQTEILHKFADARPLRVLYISAMVPEKGYLDLLDAWLALAVDVRTRLHLDLAGRFETEGDQSAFLRRIAGLSGVEYHGLVDTERKRSLFARAHVFCLPTRMFEGQPISILEAYASGCVVLTTGQRGIRDVFDNGINGFELVAGSPASIAGALTRLPDDVDGLCRIAVTNRRTAGERYRAGTFTSAVARILEGETAASR